jgi:RimJ/RimL family protein N-acetyltransferase
MKRCAIEWGELRAIEPTLDEVAYHATTLSSGYNDPHNAELMGHTQLISPVEVIAGYEEAMAAGTRSFLLFERDSLAGDGDLRGLRGDAAEFAFMIAMPSNQGKGLGTRFALMIHAFGFHELALATIYASVVPHNTASLRAFEKLGYVVDASATARAYADEPNDVTLAIDRATFERTHAGALGQIRIGVR